MKVGPPPLVLFVRDRYNKHGMAALAGALDLEDPERLGAEVRFVNSRDVPTILEFEASHHERVLLAFSFHTPHLPTTAAFLHQVATTLPPFRQTRVECLAGGPHPSGDPIGTLQAGFNYAFQGEGEATIATVIRKWAQGEDLGGTPGMVFKTETALVANDPPSPVDLDAFPPFSPPRRLLAPIEISRGCPGACGFCQTPSLFGTRMRHRSLDRVLAAMAAGRAKGLKDLRFVTPNAFAYGSPDGRTPNPGQVERLLLEAGQIFGKAHVYFGSFPSETRPESVTPEMVDLVRRLAGNDSLVVGLQTGSDDFLARLRRGHSTDDVFRAVSLAVRAGFRIYVDFIFGLPGETDADRRATARVMEQLTREGATVHGHAFIPLPGTPLGKFPPAPVDEGIRKVMDALPPGLRCGRYKHQAREAKAVAEFKAALNPECGGSTPP